MNKQIGRPPIPAEQRQNRIIRFGVTAQDKRAIESRCKELNLSLSDYFRLLFVGDKTKCTAQPTK